MSAFDSGFRMGMGAFQQALENKQREEELGWKRADRARADKQNAEVDAETANVKSMLPPAAASDSKPADPQPAASPTAAQGIPSVDAPAPEGQGAALPAAQGLAGNAPPPNNTAQMVANLGTRAFTDLDRLKGMQRLALANRDMNAVERLGGQIKTAEMDQVFGDAVKGWSSTPDRLAEVAKYVNSHPSLTMHAPDKNGMVPLSIVNADGRATMVHLNAAQLGQLAGADALMRAGHVQRGLEVVQGINDGLAKVLDTKNNLTNTVANNQNTAAYRSGQLDLSRMNAEVDRTYKNGMLAVSRERAHAAGNGSTAPGAFDPLGDFDPKQARQNAHELAKKWAENQPKPPSAKEIAVKEQEFFGTVRDAAGADNIDRRRNTAFANELRSAKTPEEMGAARVRVAKRGLTDEEIARLDPRYAPGNKPAPSPAAFAPNASPAAPGSASQATAASRAAPVAPDPVLDSDAGNAYDAARSELTMARDQARAFGLKQRRGNPDGYDAAVERVRKAEIAKGAAERQWQSFIAKQGLGASFGGGAR